MRFLSELFKRLYNKPKGVFSLHLFVFGFWPMWIKDRKSYFMVRFENPASTYRRYDNCLMSMLEHWDDYSHPLGYAKKRELENSLSWQIVKCFHNCNKALKENSENDLWLSGSLIWGTLAKIKEKNKEARHYYDLIDQSIPNIGYVLEPDNMVTNKTKIRYCHEAILETKGFLLSLPLIWSPEYDLLMEEEYTETLRELVENNLEVA